MSTVVYTVIWILAACAAVAFSFRHESFAREGAKDTAIIVGVCLLVFASGVAASYTAVSPVAFAELCVCHAALLAAARIDAKQRLIPNAIPACIVLARIACFAYEYFYSEDALGFLTSSLLGGCLCFAALSIAGKLSRGGVGGGDVKLVSALGFASGLYFVIYALTIALVAGVIAALVLIVAGKRKKEDSVPFAPFLYVGFVGAVLLSLA